MENLEKETLIQKIKDLEVILKEMDLKIGFKMRLL